MLLGVIRDKSQGWLAYVIVGFITVPFALFGISEYLTSSSNVMVASVGDDKILKEDFLLEFNPKQRRLQQQLAEQYTAQFNVALKQTVINQMIDRRLLNALATELSFVTTSAELQNSIHSDTLFKTDGVFSLEKYQQLLRINGYDPVKYESVKQQELTQNQIKYNFLDSDFINPSILEKFRALNNQQRQFDYIEMNTDQYVKKIILKSTDAQDFYDQQKTTFFEPAKIKVDFIELSQAQIAKNIKIDEAELHAFYADEQARFSTEEERKAQHILVADETIAKKVLALLKQDGDFAKLAQQYSQDTASKNQAGDLGFFTRGVMLPAFEKAVFGMKVGDISGLIQSEFGYHIIKLNQINAVKRKSFQSVRAELVKLYTQKLAQKAIYKLTEELTNLAYEGSLEETSEQMDLPIQHSEFFTKTNTSHHRLFVEAAFSKAVFDEGENSQLLELPQGKFVVLKLIQKSPQKQKTFEEVKFEIVKHLTQLSAKQFIDTLAQDLTKALSDKNQKTAKKLIKNNQLKWTKVGWIKRDTRSVNPQIANYVFALPKPKSAQPTYGVQSLSAQNVVLVKLSAIKVAKSDDALELERLLVNVRANEVFVNILKNLRKVNKIEIFEQNL